jgi:hypothetical protein
VVDNGHLRTGIIRSRPIRPVFALRFMPQRWCVLRSPGLGRSASTSTFCSRRRLRNVTVKSHWSRLRSMELSLRRVREWNGDTDCPINSDERRLLAAKRSVVETQGPRRNKRDLQCAGVLHWYRIALETSAAGGPKFGLDVEEKTGRRESSPLGAPTSNFITIDEADGRQSRGAALARESAS